jgi:pimeloyl-ACP methyl ester carboxylesterase
VADVIRVLDDLGWEQPTVAGHSWGGHLAMHVAVSHPQRVRVLAPISVRRLLVDFVGRMDR